MVGLDRLSRIATFCNWAALGPTGHSRDHRCELFRAGPRSGLWVKGKFDVLKKEHSINEERCDEDGWQGARLKDVSAILGTWIGIASALLGGYLALDAYRADIAQRARESLKRVDERVQNAFALVEKGHDPAFVNMRTRLVAAL